MGKSRGHGIDVGISKIQLQAITANTLNRALALRGGSARYR
jgi:hypothetical protein